MPTGPDVFGLALTSETIIHLLPEVIGDSADDHELLYAAVLDHKGRPVTAKENAFTPPDWQTPFTALEIGPALPKWEVATYLTQPNEIAMAARSMQLRLGIITLAIVAAAGFGGLLLMKDVRNKVALAKQKSDFVSNVSHELRTPLTSIRMFSDLLIENRGETADKTKRYAEVIGTEASRLTRLIDNVLDFSHIDRGDRQYSFQKLAIDEIVADTCAHYRPQLEREGFSVTVKFEAGESAFVLAERDALSQVLVNLFSNVEKYGAGDRREVTILTSVSGDSAIVQVNDCGPGVPEGSEHRIFERFYRAGESPDSTSGSGLGLALARELLSAHQGTISYVRREGGGSSFSISLPLAPADSSTDSLDPSLDPSRHA